MSKVKASDLSRRADWENYLKFTEPAGYTFQWVDGKENVWVYEGGTYVHAIVKKKDPKYWVVELQTTKNVSLSIDLFALSIWHFN